MSLWIKLQTSFWTHRKTMILRAAIGDDALWLMPRLWSYAAGNQPDGDFSNYTAPVLAQILGYQKDATSMLQALLEAGFLDEDMHLHDWMEHNGFHSSFADRAKKAAAARWGKKKNPKRGANAGEEKRGEEKRQALLGACLEHACSIPGFDAPEYSAIWERWLELRMAGKKPADGDWQRFFEGQFAWLGKYPPKIAADIVSDSIRNGWTGLFPPKGTNGQKPPQRRGPNI